jgi:hypothetical protein
MNRTTDYFLKIANALYPYRWILVVMFFLPFFGWSPSSTAFLGLIWCWSNAALFIVLIYGPIRHFKGSSIWENGIKQIGWLFIFPLLAASLIATIIIPYLLIKSS